MLLQLIIRSRRLHDYIEMTELVDEGSRSKTVVWIV